MYNQIKRTFAYLGPYKRLVVTSQLCMLISVAVTTLFPWTIKNIFDVALKAKDSKMLMNSLVMLTIVFCHRSDGPLQKRIIRKAILVSEL